MGMSRTEYREWKAAQDALAAEDSATRNVAKADAFVRQFIRMTPDQVSAYLDANLTDLASAKFVIKKLALMVLLLAKREYQK